MKSAYLLPYRHLTDALRDESAISVGKYRFSYERDSVIHTVSSEPINDPKQLYLHDDSGWNIREEGLIIETAICIERPFTLYSIVSEHATIGLGLILSSLESNRTEATKVANVPRSPNPWKVEIHESIRKGLYQDEISMRLVLYLDDPGAFSSGFASSSGTILGILDALRMTFDEQNQMFPTETIFEPSGILWRMDCRWSDMSMDAFSKDNVRLLLNTAHPDYPRIDPDSQRFDPFLFKEVTASAVTVLLEEAITRPDWNDVINDENPIPGTVGSVMSYMVNTLGLDVSSPSTIASSIRKYLQKEMRRWNGSAYRRRKPRRSLIPGIIRTSTIC